MDEQQWNLQVDGQTIGLTARRHPRAKHLSLHLSQEGRLRLTIPPHVSWQAAERFIGLRHEWIKKHAPYIAAADCARERYLCQDGDIVPCWGRALTVRLTVNPKRQRATAARRGNSLCISLASEADARRTAERWYRRQARIFFAQQCYEMAARINVKVKNVRIGNFTTQWGSCSPDNVLSFNWRLSLAPQEVGEYVAAHEVAHLRHRHHQPAFWDLVGQLNPDYGAAKHWLKNKAHHLVW